MLREVRRRLETRQKQHGFCSRGGSRADYEFDFAKSVRSNLPSSNHEFRPIYISQPINLCFTNLKSIDLLWSRRRWKYHHYDTVYCPQDFSGDYIGAITAVIHVQMVGTGQRGWGEVRWPVAQGQDLRLDRKNSDLTRAYQEKMSITRETRKIFLEWLRILACFLSGAATDYVEISHQSLKSLPEWHLQRGEASCIQDMRINDPKCHVSGDPSPAQQCEPSVLRMLRVLKALSHEKWVLRV